MKLNLRSLMALLLALCLLLGGVAALAEDVPTDAAAAPAAPAAAAATEQTAVPTDDVDDDIVAIPEAPAPVDTTVTVAAGEGGQVIATVTDISSTTSNVGLEINADVKTDDDGKVVSAKDTLEVNDSDKLLTDEGKKLIEGADDLVVNAGDIAENLSQPVEIRTPLVDDEGNPVLDENGQQIVDVEYRDSVTALEINTDEDSSKETITVNTGDLYAKTTAVAKDDDTSYAEGVNVYNWGKEDTVTLNIDGTVYTDVERPETEDKVPEATAWGPYVTSEQGSDTDVFMDDALTSASAKGKNAEAYAYGVYASARDEGSTTDIVMDDVLATATATGEKTDAYANGLQANAGNKGKTTVIADNVTATAAGTESAVANGLLVNARTGSTVDATVIDPVNASATVVDAEGIAVQASDKEIDADATAIDASAENGALTIDVFDDVMATSNGNATALRVEAYGSDKVWDSKAKQDVENTTPGKADVTVYGNVMAEGTQTVAGINASAETDENYNEQTKEFDHDKQGGTTDVQVIGNVFAQGAETHSSNDTIAGAKVYSETNATVNLGVTGDVTATGKDAVGLNLVTEKGAKANVLVEGTVAGDGVAISALKSEKYVYVDEKGEVTNKDAKPTEYDPTAANVYVWAAKENADGRIATVYDEIVTRTEKEVTKTREDGTTYVDTEYSYDTRRVVDEEASAKLEQAIWYIVGVNSKWQKRVTATGTGTYTANDTTYQVAHQDDSITLNIKLGHNKKLRKIMFNDGVEADYVKNADGTYTIKMLRGGAMDLKLKVKNKYNPTAATEATAAAEDKEVNGVKASDRLELVEAMKKIGAQIDANGAAVTVPGAAKLLSEDEMKAFDKLDAKDRLLATLCAMGFADEVKAEADGLSEDGKALADAIAERIAGLSDDDKKAHEGAVAEQFPKGSETVDGAKRDTFRFDMTVEKDGKAENDSYTFFDDNGTWKLCGAEAK